MGVKCGCDHAGYKKFVYFNTCTPKFGPHTASFTYVAARCIYRNHEIAIIMVCMTCNVLMIVFLIRCLIKNILHYFLLFTLAYTTVDILLWDILLWD